MKEAMYRNGDRWRGVGLVGGGTWGKGVGYWE